MPGPRTLLIKSPNTSQNIIRPFLIAESSADRHIRLEKKRRVTGKEAARDERNDDRKGRMEKMIGDRTGRTHYVKKIVLFR